MPIRINLLAEAQAAEEIRRRDPVKRAIVMASVLVGAVLVWSASLQVKLLSDSGESSRLQNSLGSKTNDYVKILGDERKLTETKNKLDSLRHLATDRFLQSELLNALQRTTLEGIQVTSIRIDQNFTTIPEVKPSMVDNRHVPGKPASSIEKVTLAIDARDTSPNPGGEAMNHLKEVIAHHIYFQRMGVTTNSILLRDMSSPQVDPDTGASFVQFKFECRYPDLTRQP